MKKTIYILVLLALALPATVFGQMFSLDERQRNGNPSETYIRIGFKAIDTAFMGAESGWNQHPSPPFNYTGEAVTAIFETFSFTVSLAQSLFLGPDSHHYFNFGLGYTYPFYLYNSRTLQLGIPVNLSTEHTTLRNQNVSESLSFTTLNIGAGAQVNYIQRGKFGSHIQFFPGIGFYRLGRDFVDGRVFSLNGKFRLNLYDILFGKSISVGYDYQFTANRNTSDGAPNLLDRDPNFGARDRHDHDFNIHTITLGIAF